MNRIHRIKIYGREKYIDIQMFSKIYSTPLDDKELRRIDIRDKLNDDETIIYEMLNGFYITRHENQAIYHLVKFNTSLEVCFELSENYKIALAKKIELEMNIKKDLIINKQGNVT